MPWRVAREYYIKAMNARGEEAIALYDKCIDVLSKASEKESNERNRFLLYLNMLQAEANKRAVLANILKDKAEFLHEQYLKDAAYHHLEASLLREEAASIAKKLGDTASHYNLMGCAYQDKAFYHSYLALMAQRTSKMSAGEYRKALRFLEIALHYYNLSLSVSINEETENNRFQCLRYLENFREDMMKAERNEKVVEEEVFVDFIFIINEVREIIDGAKNTHEKLKEVCELLKENVYYYDWVGFYGVENEELVLKAFAGGKVTHTRIPFGKGVCGRAAVKKECIMVEDVSKETNYLSCNPNVKAEIVVPVIKNEKVVGELDIDSYTLSPFSYEDKRFLEVVCSHVSYLF